MNLKYSPATGELGRLDSIPINVPRLGDKEKRARARRNRDKILRKLNAVEIGAAIYFKTPVHRTPLYMELGYGCKTLKNTKEASRRVISLPVHPALDCEDMEGMAQGFLATAGELL
jgi:dTDP-4-amino-4,6-dideoxygalactose transaminase